MKNIIAIAALGSLFAISASQAAGNGTVNFSGKLVNQTCNAAINNGSNTTTVALPAVQAGALPTSGSTAGTTNFTVTITGCNSPSVGGSGSVKAFFENGANVDASGRLVNTTAADANGATNVSLQLIDNTLNAPVVIGSASQAASNDTPGNNGYTVIRGGAATLSYAVRYYATGAATAGRVTSAVTYSLNYY